MQNLSRRGILGAGLLAAGSAGLALGTDQPRPGRAQRCIVLMLIGGPSQLETWDPKPDAPAEMRGPFGTIPTSITGVRISEHLPRLASLAHRYAIIRSLHHDAPPIHETGLQLLQTGRLCSNNHEAPHFGAVLAQQRTGGFVILPMPIGNTGINVSRGQSAGPLGPAHEPSVQANFTHLLAPTDRERYGKTTFGDACARALQLVEAGTRCAVVNMFDSVYDRVTWDCHAARRGFTSTLADYRRTICPAFDCACATLLDDLHQRGLLDETLVLAMGEMGRTPRLNANGGRDHWPGCWSIMMAGGGVRGGEVIGVSDRIGSEPHQRPVTCPEVVASVYHALGLPRFVGAAPVRELFAGSV